MVDIEDNVSLTKEDINLKSFKEENENNGYESLKHRTEKTENQYENANSKRYENAKGGEFVNEKVRQYENASAGHFDVKVNQYNNTDENQYETVSETNSRRGSQAVSSTGSYDSQSSRPETPAFFPVFPKRVQSINEKYECLKCKRVLNHPVQISPCGHHLCYLCFKEIINDSSDEKPPKCPKDKQEIDSDNPNLNKDLWNEIQSLDVVCENIQWGCQWEGNIMSFEDHNEECPYTDVLCKTDCGAKFQRRYITKHEEKDCPKKVISCPYCGERHLREDKKNHFEECEHIPLPCPNKCDKKLTIERSKLENHVDNECPRTKILCMFENIGCAHRSSREKMAKHYSKQTSSHVRMLFDMLLKQAKSIEVQDERLLASEQSLMDQDKRIGDLEKIAHSQLIWRIEDYTRKLKECRAGNVDSIFSPTFTTSKHGYRLCASVCLNGDGKGKGSHMSVFISVLKGHYDPLLKWPFEYRVTFLLLDQNEDVNARKHIKFSIKPNPCPENVPFLGRPKMEKNASFGGAKFARHEEIESGGYIKDDVIFLKIAVDCDGLSEP